MIVENAMTNREAVGAGTRARDAGGSRGNLIRTIVNVRADIPDADNITYVLNQLDRIVDARIGAVAERSAKDLADQERVSVEDMRQGLKNLDNAARAGALAYNDPSSQAVALTLKDKAGEAMLDEKLGQSRADLDALIEGLDLPTPPMFLNDLEAQQSGAIESFKKSVGGNGEASRMFLAELEKEAPGKRRTQQTINALYRQWLLEKAQEHDPMLSQALASAERMGAAIIDRAKEVAGVTPRHAAQLAASRVQSGSGVRSVVSRAGWKPKQFDADMVELMQVAGKAIPQDAKITVGSKGDIEQSAGTRFRSYRGRSFHSEGGEKGMGRVNRTYVCLSGEVGKRTLYHEVGHAIEAVNPAANAMISRWLKRRIEGKDAQRLSALTGVRAYKRSEVAVKDNFIDPYVGKVYKPRMGIQSNEVLAMGLERLADPMSAAQLATKDPDHLALILAALQTEYQP